MITAGVRLFWGFCVIVPTPMAQGHPTLLSLEQPRSLINGQIQPHFQDDDGNLLDTLGGVETADRIRCVFYLQR